MKKLKQFYLSPETELLVIRFEENILSFNNDGTEIPDDGGEENF